MSTVLLAGCVDWPEAGSAPSVDEGGPWPILKPIDEVIGPQSPENPQAGKQLDVLSDRATRLKSQASAMRREVAGPEDIEALRSELAR
ncbi:MAG: hypothetical protein F4186_07345 [Boseongicola sp. SB0676_bin_33]|nr:hypothetical protein [Boseongicola sp. SB0676_bin_33]